MDDSVRFAVTPGSKRDGARDVIVGNAFAFFKAGISFPPGMEWLARAMGAAPAKGPQVVSLLRETKYEINGLSIEPTRLPKFNLCSITSDKSLYRNDRDTVNLLVLNPLTPESELVLSVRCNGQEFSKHSVRLGRNGEGQLILRDLPVGEFDVSPRDANDTPCQFTVAEYRLVPLVASLTSSQMQGDQLQVELKLESFGVPVNGQVRIDLKERNVRCSSQTTEARNGQANATFKLEGLGPYSLALQLADDPSKTASVPIRGSRAAERSATVFSPLGSEVSGTLIAEPGSNPVRGIYLRAGATRTTPISLERVDTANPRLLMNTKVESIRVIAVDPTYPQRKYGALDIAQSPHPETIDERYRQADKLLKEGKYADACALFDKSRSVMAGNPHPYYAYSIACCHARLGRIEHALTMLREAIADGWIDHKHMAEDDDLATLKGNTAFEALVNGGQREISMNNVPAGQVIEVEGFAPVTILLIGAFINGKPWEGWASAVPPSTVSTRISIPEKRTPGKELVIDIGVFAERPASVYAVLKDARLLSTDTPETRLAAGIKKLVDEAGKEVSLSSPDQTVHAILEKLQPQPSRFGMVGGVAGTSAWDVPAGGGSWGSATGSFGSGLMMRAADTGPRSLSQNYGAAEGMSADGPPLTLAESIRRKVSQTESMAAGDEVYGMATKGGIFSVEELEAPEITTPLATSDPEIVYAGFVPVNDGTAQLRVTLPDVFADYIVECLAIAGNDWAITEARFKAEKDPIASLTVPVFARADEKATGTLFIGSAKEKVQVKLLRDGIEVQLLENQKLFNSAEPICGKTVSLQFNAVPGEYQAIIMSASGTIIERIARNVDEPGKLKRRLRTLRLLESGQSVALSGDNSVVSIKLMPSIDTAFNLLVDATADYSHCCCEQTAAKIMSACTMYMLASGGGGGGSAGGGGSNGGGSSGNGGSTEDRRKKAESIIIAGVRREQSMWLKGRGLKSYPEAYDEPNVHLSEQAVRSLWQLTLLKDEGADLSRDLNEAVDLGLQIAGDVTASIKLQWPPQQIQSCADAYNILRHGDKTKDREALQHLVNYDPGKPAPQAPWMHHMFGVLVCSRIEAAYAAAGLLRVGGAQHMRKALDMANNVIGQFNEQGRLYSTADSVAAIALMSELQAARVTGGSGMVEVDGTACSMKDAFARIEPITSLKVSEGCAMAAVDRIVEEDWSTFGSNVQMRVALTQNGRDCMTFAPGDAIDLKVTLEEGYKDGDLLWVCLPDALSAVIGGGQVKLFSIDFCSKSEVTIPLAATGVTHDKSGQGTPQRLALCLRNMFDEERAASPGLLSITVK